MKQSKWNRSIIKKVLSVVLVAVFSFTSFIPMDLLISELIFGKGGYRVYAEELPPGSAWVPRESGVSSNIMDVIYANNLFVAVGAGGTILTSEDGSTWTSRVSNTSNLLKQVIYSGTRFVAVGDVGTILTSEDGLTWTSRASGVSTELNTVAYATDGTNHTYIAAGRAATILKSVDGLTWAKQTISSVNSTYQNLYRAEYQSGRFIINSNYGSIYFSNSLTATSWSYSRNSLSYDNMVDNPAFGEGKAIFPGSEKDRWLISVQDNTTTLAYVEVPSSGSLPTNTRFKTARFLNNKFYIGSTNGIICFLGDGSIWTQGVTDTIKGILDIAYEESKYYAIGSQGLIMESLDGNNWISVNSGTSNSLRKLARSNNVIVAVGEAGTIVTRLLNDTLADSDRVALDKLALTDSLILNGNTSLSSIVGNLSLISVGQYGSTITWVSSNTDILNNNGQVISRPEYGEGDAIVTLTATISRGDATDTREYVLTIKELDISDAEAVAAAKIVLEIGYGTGDSSSNVTQNLTLTTSGANSTTISWSSNNTAVISNTGTVTRPTYTTGNQTLTLTATISRGGVQDTKTFTVTVTALPISDAEAVAAAKIALSIGYGTGDSSSNITKNVSLATSGANSTTINWSSNNTTVIGNTGVVTRPTYTTGNQIVILTATISRGGVQDIKTFVITVKALPISDSESVSLDKTSLTNSSILNRNTALNNITGPLNLYKTGQKGSIIGWSSSDTSLVSVSGLVNRPTFLQGDKNITITAIIRKGLVIDAKSFSLTIKALPISNEESVRLDTAALNISLGSGDTLQNVTKDLSLLPQVGANGSVISWLSSNPNILSSSGEVTRPPKSGIDTKVTLTATITKGNESSRKDFLLIVTRDMVVPDIISSSPTSKQEDFLRSGVIEINFNENIYLNEKSLPYINKITTETKSEWKTYRWEEYQVEIRTRTSANVSISGSTLSISPTAMLSSDTRYEIVIPNGAVWDKSGNLFETPLITHNGVKNQRLRVIAFKTGRVIEPLTIISQFPASGAVNVDRKGSFKITFNQQIKKGINFENISLKSGVSSKTINTLISGDSLIISYDGHLEADRLYSLTLPERSLTTTSANHFNSEHIISFTSGRIMVTTLPDDRAVNIAVNQPILINYDTSIKQGPRFNEIQIVSHYGASLDGDCQVFGEELMITLKNDGDYEFSTFYEVKIPHDAIREINETPTGAVQLLFRTVNRIADRVPMFTHMPVQVTGESITFDASTIFHQIEVKHGRSVESYEWDLGDGSIQFGAKIDHIYNTPGYFTVSLKIVDDRGQKYIQSSKVDIRSISAVSLSVTPDGLYLHNHKAVTSSIPNPSVRNFRATLKADTIGLANRNVEVFINNIKLLDTFTNANGDVDFSVLQGHLSFGNNIVSFRSHGIKIDRAIRYQEATTSEYKFTLPVGAANVVVNLDGSRVNYTRSGEFYVLKNIPTGPHTVKVTADKYYTTSVEIDLFRKSHTGAINMRPNIPGDKPAIISVYSDQTDSNGDLKLFFTGVKTELEINVSMDWKNHKPGYYKFITDDGEFTTTQPTIVIAVGKLKPATGLKVVAVSALGVESAAVDAQIMAADKPSFIRNISSDIMLERAKQNLSTIGGAIADTFTPVTDKLSPIVGTVNKYHNSISEQVANGRDYINENVNFSMPASFPAIETPAFPSSFPLVGNAKFGFDANKLDLTGLLNERNELVFNISRGMDKMTGNRKRFGTNIGGVRVEGAVEVQLTYRYNMENNDWDYVKGQFVLEIDGSVKYRQTYFITPIPIPLYMQATMGLNAEGILVYKYNDEAEKFDRYGSLQLSPYVEIVMGAGISKVYVEGYLKGQIQNKFYFPDGDIEINAELNGGIRAKILFWSYRNNLLHYKWNLLSTVGQSNGVMQLASLDIGNSDAILIYDIGSESEFLDLNSQNGFDFSLIPDYELFEPMERSSSKGAEGWQVPAQKQEEMGIMLFAAFGMEEDKHIEDTLLQSNIYDFPEQMLIALDDKLVMTWVADNGERTDMNRTELMTSVYDGALWSFPGFMGLTPTADFNPAMGAASGKLLSAWESSNTILEEEATLLDMIKSIEIVVAESEDGVNWVNDLQLTSNDYLDHSPELAAAGDQAILLWISNQGNDHAGSFENPNEIMFSMYNGAWSTPEVILTIPGAIASSRLAFNGTTAVYVYVLDGDDDLETTNDQELYAVTYNPATDSWSEPIRLTNNTVRDTSPELSYIDEELMLIWYQNDQLVYKKGLAGAVTVIDGVVQPSGSLSMTRYKDERLAVVYTMSAAKGNGIYATIYDINNNVWNNPIPLVENECLNRSLSPIFDEDGNLHVVYTKTELVEGYSGDNVYYDLGEVSLAVVTLYPRYDLAVNTSDIYTSHDNPVPGSTVELTAIIRNEGDYSIRNSMIEFFDGDPVGGGVKIGATVIINDAIPARGSAEASVEWMVPVDNDPHTIYVVVSTLEDLESNNRKTNNTSFARIIASDLELSKFTYKAIEGDKYLFLANVANIGSVDLTETEIRLYKEGGILVASEEVPALMGGELTQVSFIWDASEALIESYLSLLVEVVQPQHYEEYTLANNTYSFDLAKRELAINYFGPAPNTQRAAVDQDIVIAFNTSIKEGNSYTDITLMDAEGNNILVSSSIEENVLTISPVDELEYDKFYTFILDKDNIEGLNGNQLTQQFILGFKTESFEANPVITFTYPADRMVDVQLDSEIVIIFNETIIGENLGEIQLIDEDGHSLAVTSGISGNTLTLNHAGLSTGKEYTVLLPAGVVKNAHNYYMLEEHTFSFKTLVAGESNADLSNLVISTGGLSPSFSSETQSYTVNVSSTVNSITVTATVASSRGTLSINYQAAVSGNGRTIALGYGANTVVIKVLAEDGITEKTYTLTVNRDSIVSEPSSGGTIIVQPSQPEQKLEDKQEPKKDEEVSEDEAEPQIREINEHLLQVRIQQNQKLGTEELIRALKEDLSKTEVVFAFEEGAESRLELSLELIELMAERSGKIIIKTATAQLSLNSKDIGINRLLEGLSTNSSEDEIKVTLMVSVVEEQQAASINSSLAEKGITAIGDPISIHLSVGLGDLAEDVRSFEGYVQLLIPIQEGEASITTAVVYDKHGRARHQPTSIVEIDGSLFIRVNTLSTGVFSIISNSTEFEDAKDHWASETINDMGSRLIINGVDGINFEPDRSITRAEFVTIILNGMGLVDARSYDTEFSDVNDSDWYSENIKIASAYSLINGYADGSFGAERQISRQEAMVILTRAMKLINPDLGMEDEEGEQLLKRFEDGSDISSWAQQAIALVVDMDIVKGYEDGSLKPLSSITRAETATIIKRMLNLMGFTGK